MKMVMTRVNMVMITPLTMICTYCWPADDDDDDDNGEDDDDYN